MTIPEASVIKAESLKVKATLCTYLSSHILTPNKITVKSPCMLKLLLEADSLSLSVNTRVRRRDAEDFHFLLLKLSCDNIWHPASEKKKFLFLTMTFLSSRSRWRECFHTSRQTLPQWLNQANVSWLPRTEIPYVLLVSTWQVVNRHRCSVLTDNIAPTHRSHLSRSDVRLLKYGETYQYLCDKILLK